MLNIHINHEEKTPWAGQVVILPNIPGHIDVVEIYHRISGRWVVQGASQDGEGVCILQHWSLRQGEGEGGTKGPAASWQIVDLQNDESLAPFSINIIKEK